MGGGRREAFGRRRRSGRSPGPQGAGEPGARPCDRPVEGLGGAGQARLEFGVVGVEEAEGDDQAQGAVVVREDAARRGRGVAPRARGARCRGGFVPATPHHPHRDRDRQEGVGVARVQGGQERAPAAHAAATPLAQALQVRIVEPGEADPGEALGLDHEGVGGGEGDPKATGVEALLDRQGVGRLAEPAPRRLEEGGAERAGDPVDVQVAGGDPRDAPTGARRRAGGGRRPAGEARLAREPRRAAVDAGAEAQADVGPEGAEGPVRGVVGDGVAQQRDDAVGRREPVVPVHVSRPRSAARRARCHGAPVRAGIRRPRPGVRGGPGA